QRDLINEALVFTRTKHRANRLWEFLLKHGVRAARIHGNRSQAQRTDALAGFKSGSYRVLVATDIAARGIDVEELGHVVNFDVPLVAEDYIHRVGRTARAEATGEAYTFVSPEEADDLRSIERAVGKALPRVTIPGFDYDAKPAAKLEIPIAERLAKHRAQRAVERQRAKEKEARRAGAQVVPSVPSQSRASQPPATSQSQSPYRDESSGGGGGRRRRRRRGGGGGRSR
ncbi:MAG TPA: helicase-related protein, partial [Gemmatimonadaceae bacterium]|nr:helicase-related protein [Gemmatimonadaceae bacterium]